MQVEERRDVGMIIRMNLEYVARGNVFNLVGYTYTLDLLRLATDEAETGR